MMIMTDTSPVKKFIAPSAKIWTPVGYANHQNDTLLKISAAALSTMVGRKSNETVVNYKIFKEY